MVSAVRSLMPMRRPRSFDDLGTTKKRVLAGGRVGDDFRRLIAARSPRPALFFIVIAITEVIGSTPSTSTSFNCSTKPRMVLSSPFSASASSSLTAIRASRATRLTVSLSTDMGNLPGLPARYSRAGFAGGKAATPHRRGRIARYDPAAASRPPPRLAAGRTDLMTSVRSRTDRRLAPAFAATA